MRALHPGGATAPTVHTPSRDRPGADFLAFAVDADVNVVETWPLYISLAFSPWSAWVSVRDSFKAMHTRVHGGPGVAQGS